MTGTDDRDLDLVRKSARELARRFDLGCWRERDKKGEYPWEFVRAFAEGGWLISQEMVLNFISTSVLGLPRSY